MAEPEKKFEEIQPDIKPHFGVVEGGRQSTPGRASLKGLEKQESKPEKPNTGSVAEQEASGSNIAKGPWANKTTGGGSASTSLKAGGLFTKFKKKSPATAIIIAVVGGGIGIVGLLSPSLLLVQIKEVMVNKFNSQLTSMDVRTRHMYKKKATGGLLCTSKVSILCKYSTMSEKQAAKFEKAGIKVISNGDKTLLGRIKPKSFEFNGKSISASDFDAMLKSNAEFGSAVKLAYNPKFAGFADKIWKKAAAKLGISKIAADIAGETDEARLKKIQDQTKNPVDVDSAKVSEVIPDDPNYIDPDTGEPYTAARAAEVNAERRAAAEAANEIIETAEDAAKRGAKAAPKALAVSAVVNTLKITGLMDNACAVFSAIRAVGFAAKTVRVLQLARYAMIFLNVADQIKAGTAKQDDVDYLGKVLTTEVAASAKSVKLGTATNSFGYRYAAYGKGGKMSDTATQFLAGGGLAGSLIGLTSLVDKALGGQPISKCGLLANPLVGFGSLLVGVALFLVPGVNIAVGAWDLAKVAMGVAFMVALAYLPALLQDIVAGVLVDDTTVGEASGEAITSGASGIMGTSAKTGGNAPLTPAQAVAYNNLSNEIAEQYAEEDRLAYSPFDISNNNTFMGKIVAQLIPYAGNMSSLSGIFSSIASISTGSFASLTSQTAKATSIEDYTMCQDYDYRDLNLATDPYCNVLYGIPTEALDADPIEVINALGSQINPETGDPAIGSDYAKFVTDCIDRVRPLGDAGANGSDSDGSECLFNNENKNFYIHYIDQRVQSGLDGEDLSGAGGGSTNPTNPTTDPVPADTLAYCSDNYGKYTSQSDLKSIYGSSESAVSGNIVSVDFPFRDGIKSIRVHKIAAPCFKAVAQALSTVSHRPISNDGTFNWRPNVNNPSVLSLHSFGIAIDFDAAQNPNGGGSPPNCKTNMPADFVAVFKKYGFRWGGDYRSTCDAMHYEWLGGVL